MLIFHSSLNTQISNFSPSRIEQRKRRANFHKFFIINKKLWGWEKNIHSFFFWKYRCVQISNTKNVRKQITTWKWWKCEKNKRKCLCTKNSSYSLSSRSHNFSDSLGTPPTHWRSWKNSTRKNKKKKKVKNFPLTSSVLFTFQFGLAVIFRRCRFHIFFDKKSLQHKKHRESLKRGKFSIGKKYAKKKRIVYCVILVNLSKLFSHRNGVIVRCVVKKAGLPSTSKWSFCERELKKKVDFFA